MSKLIITSDEELRKIISEAFAGLMPIKGKMQKEIDTIALPAAIDLLVEYGFPTSKAKLYKLTSNRKIPFRKYGNKLIFSRRELLMWADSQAVSKPSYDDVALQLGREARRKR